MRSMVVGATTQAGAPFRPLHRLRRSPSPVIRGRITESFVRRLSPVERNT